jgi:hypothetical protein
VAVAALALILGSIGAGFVLGMGDLNGAGAAPAHH